MQEGAGVTRSQIRSMNREDEAQRGEASLHIKREDIRHPRHNCIKQIVVMLWAFQLLSAAVGVDCQEAKEGAESEKKTHF